LESQTTADNDGSGVKAFELPYTPILRDEKSLTAIQLIRALAR
jgi:hypothetical protein